MPVLAINQFFWPDTAATGQLLLDLIRELEGDATVICGASGYGAVDGSGAPPSPGTIVLRSRPIGFSHSTSGRLASYASFYLGAVVNGFFRVSPRPDVILTMTTPPLLSVLGEVLRRVRFRGARHYIWEMDLYPDIGIDLGVLNPSSITTRVIGVLGDWSRRNADGIIALGEDMKERLMARGIPESKIHVAENWADGREITPGPFAGRDDGPLTVHYSGNLGLAHDVETICQVMLALRGDSLPARFRFVFAGGGPRRGAVERFCSLHGIGNVEFRSYAARADLGASLAEGHIGLVTQLPETCGSVVPSKTYGIMAAGRGVLFIGPKGAMPGRIVARHQCGWQFEVGDVDGVVEFLKRACADREMVFAAGARARAAFEREYDLPIGVARVAGILGLGVRDRVGVVAV